MGTEPVNLEKAWIYKNPIFVKGETIGKASLVGVYLGVTKDVLLWKIAVRNRERIIREITEDER